jgi:hypothetical protein
MYVIPYSPEKFFRWVILASCSKKKWEAKWCYSVQITQLESGSDFGPPYCLIPTSMVSNALLVYRAALRTRILNPDQNESSVWGFFFPTSRILLFWLTPITKSRLTGVMSCRHAWRLMSVLCHWLALMSGDICCMGQFPHGGWYIDGGLDNVSTSPWKMAQSRDFIIKLTVYKVNDGLSPWYHAFWFSQFTMLTGLWKDNSSFGQC